MELFFVLTLPLAFIAGYFLGRHGKVHPSVGKDDDSRKSDEQTTMQPAETPENGDAKDDVQERLGLIAIPTDSLFGLSMNEVIATGVQWTMRGDQGCLIYDFKESGFFVRQIYDFGWDERLSGILLYAVTEDYHEMTHEERENVALSIQAQLTYLGVDGSQLMFSNTKQDGGPTMMVYLSFDATGFAVHFSPNTGTVLTSEQVEEKNGQMYHKASIQRDMSIADEIDEVGDSDTRKEFE